jgi:DNA-directed RNA polymerase subunit H (RpoH/RPB5)
MMDTLTKFREHERIVKLYGPVDDKSKTAYVTVELQKRDGAILIFMNHSDDIVKIVLNEIDPIDSGYIFFASELQLDPLNNKMVPTHRLATHEEKEELIKKHIPKHKLPILRLLDPIRRWHNFPKGSIITIERPTGKYFRRVE